MIRIAGKGDKLRADVFPDSFYFKRGDDMKRIALLLAATLLLSAGTAFATATTQKWTTGWDNFSEPLDLAHSKIVWSVSATRKLTLTFTLVGATPTKLYQVSLNFFCNTFPATFGQFPTERNADGSCIQLTRQGVTATAAEAEVGVVFTDIHGKGSFKVVIGPVASGTYELEFFARNGAGCDVAGGGGNDVNHCEADFQSPGPFGTATTIVVP